MDSEYEQLVTEKEWHDRAINQVQSGLTVGDLREMHRAGVLPARGTVHYRALFEEAAQTVLAGLYLRDKVLFYNAVKRMRTEKGIGAMYDFIMRAVEAVSDGLDEWEQTVFETIRSRPHLYEDEWSDPVVNAYPGFIKMDRKLKFLASSIDMDQARKLAFGWLEGDESVQPLNKPKSRHRDNGDWILVFGRKAFTGLDSRIQTVTVAVSQAAFLEHSIMDWDNGDWSKVELKRGRKPAVQLAARIIAAKAEQHTTVA